jgi:hypothetical protein
VFLSLRPAKNCFDVVPDNHLYTLEHNKPGSTPENDRIKPVSCVNDLLNNKTEAMNNSDAKCKAYQCQLPPKRQQFASISPHFFSPKKAANNRCPFSSPGRSPLMVYNLTA